MPDRRQASITALDWVVVAATVVIIVCGLVEIYQNRIRPATSEG